jgi:hypothetical protein
LFHNQPEVLFRSNVKLIRRSTTRIAIARQRSLRPIERAAASGEKKS